MSCNGLIHFLIYFHYLQRYTPFDDDKYLLVPTLLLGCFLFLKDKFSNGDGYSTVYEFVHNKMIVSFGLCLMFQLTVIHIFTLLESNRSCLHIFVLYMIHSSYVSAKTFYYLYHVCIYLLHRFNHWSQPIIRPQVFDINGLNIELMTFKLCASGFLKAVRIQIRGHVLLGSIKCFCVRY
ncbi:hypothetical protein AGLY_014766 [Aphis glycines]|uniref:Uncharacterized protein n=1 Tax=Aphis glycines TaxID=307491 RepID=A0A6G0T253_APHGL|nr:hypothetical protein AGLY_014766 [Aphis glycines]